MGQGAASGALSATANFPHFQTIDASELTMLKLIGSGAYGESPRERDGEVSCRPQEAGAKGTAGPAARRWQRRSRTRGGWPVARRARAFRISHFAGKVWLAEWTGCQVAVKELFGLSGGSGQEEKEFTVRARGRPSESTGAA